MSDVQSNGVTACHYATSVWCLSMFESRSMKPITVTYFCHYSCCLAYGRSLASSYFSKTMPRQAQHTRHTSFQKLIFHKVVNWRIYGMVRSLITFNSKFLTVYCTHYSSRNSVCRNSACRNRNRLPLSGLLLIQLITGLWEKVQVSCRVQTRR